MLIILDPTADVLQILIWKTKAFLWLQKFFISALTFQMTFWRHLPDMSRDVATSHQAKSDTPGWKKNTKLIEKINSGSQ